MSDSLQTLEGKIEPIELEDEMRSSFIDYAMSVLTDRALPSLQRVLVCDGSVRPGVGVAKKTADNSAGAAGAISVEYERGVFGFNNDAGDPVTLANVNATVFMSDDNTVSKTNGGATKSAAGVLVDVDAQFAWVRI